MGFHAQAAHAEVLHIFFLDTANADTASRIGWDLHLGFKRLVAFLTTLEFKAGANAKDGAAQLVAHFKHHQVRFVIRPSRLDAQLLQLGNGEFGLSQLGFLVKKTHGMNIHTCHPKKPKQAHTNAIFHGAVF